MTSPPKEKRGLGTALEPAELTQRSQSRHATSTSVVGEIRNLFGNDVVLLPIKCGTKKPSGKELRGWQKFTPAQMRNPEYVAGLNHGENIGVLLGNGLSTIDLDRDEDVEPFLNPDSHPEIAASFSA